MHRQTISRRRGKQAARVSLTEIDGSLRVVEVLRCNDDLSVPKMYSLTMYRVSTSRDGS